MSENGNPQRPDTHIEGHLRIDCEIEKRRRHQRLVIRYPCGAVGKYQRWPIHVMHG